MSDEWLDFIASCRNGQPHDYDIVEDPMADDTVYNNNALFYICSLIEFIARKTKNCRGFIVDCLGDDIRRIYSHQDVFHCEPIEKVADDFIRRASINVINRVNFL